MTVNISEGKQYLSQLNNKISPMSTCNTTSAIMALEASEIVYKVPSGWANPVDFLTATLQTDQAYDLMEKKYPWALRDGYEPNQVHGMLEWAINRIVGKPVDRFVTSASITMMLSNLYYKRKAVMVSGRFTAYGHIVCVVGFRSSQPEEHYIVNGFHPDMVETIIIDDPYGDWHTGYKNRNGDNVEFTFDEFNYLTRTYNMTNNKWMHIFH